MDWAIAGDHARCGYTRAGVLRGDFYEVAKKLKQSSGWSNINATRRRHQLDSPANSTTGWFSESFHTETVEALIMPKAMQQFVSQQGNFVKTDALAYSWGLSVGDRLESQSSELYEVKTNQPQRWGVGLLYYTNDLVLLETENLTAKTYTESIFEDAKYRTKVWLDSHLNNAALPHYLVAYSFPDYLLIGVLKEKNLDVVFSVGDSVTTALYNRNDKSVYGYSERVPITICTIDKSNLSGVEAKWQAETELRRLCEEHPFYSLRLMDTRRDTTQRLGATTLYQTEFTITYKRSSDVIPTVPSITWGSYDSEEETFEGTYIFPAVIEVRYPDNVVSDAKLSALRRVGNIKDSMGDSSLKVKITCDLDVAPWIPGGAQLTWKRPQTEISKQDKVKFQVILDIKHNGAIDEEFQLLTLDWGSFFVRLVDFDVRQENDTNILEVTFEEYNSSDASGKALVTRYNIP